MGPSPDGDCKEECKQPERDREQEPEVDRASPVIGQGGK
jgi:hypothetical protein